MYITYILYFYELIVIKCGQKKAYKFCFTYKYLFINL